MRVRERRNEDSKDRRERGGERTSTRALAGDRAVGVELKNSERQRAAVGKGRGRDARGDGGGGVEGEGEVEDEGERAVLRG